MGEAPEVPSEAAQVEAASWAKEVARAMGSQGEAEVVAQVAGGVDELVGEAGAEVAATVAAANMDVVARVAWEFAEV
jgi:hypothetical protein